MSKKSVVGGLAIKSYDDIFTTDEGRGDALLEKVMEIPLSELHQFSNHPFKVLDDEAMTELAASITENGVIHPGIARPREGGGYELVAGHRRKRACELAGKETMRVIVRDMSDEEAVLMMVDTNLYHRETLLFSERAFAYKMKADAVKRQAGRPVKDNYSQAGINLSGKNCYEIVGEQAGESKNQIYRFIRLTELIEALLEMVDEKKLGFTTAVELSYLTEAEQWLLIHQIDKDETLPSLSQAQRMKQHSKDGTLNEAVMAEIMREVKKDEVKVTFTHTKLKKYFPGFVTPQDMEEVIIKLLEGWYKRKQQE